MRLMLHTFTKDARRLWPAIAVSWLMLGVLTNADRWRADWMASPMEGWMTLLLSMAWACVAALVVQEEPLVGDRHFWTTRPHRWPALLAAKLLFVLLAIHAPMFLADLYILAARGFSPAPYLGELLVKQLLFFGALTLPAMALASVVRNFTHFVIAVFAIAAGIAMLTGMFQAERFYRWEPTEVRHAVVLGVLVLAAIAIVLVQYAKRRALFARALAVAAALTAGSVSAYMPARLDYSVGANQPEPRIALRQAAPDEQILRSIGPLPRQRVVAIPVSIDSGRFHIRDVDVEIVAPNGVRVRSVRPIPNDPNQKIPFLVWLYPTNWLVLRFTPSEWERVKNASVDIIGSAGVQFYRLGKTTTMPTTGTHDVPDVGKCTVSNVEDRFYEEMFKLLCESPHDIPPTAIRLTHPPSGREWEAGLRSATNGGVRAPYQTWFSPLKRGQALFRLTEEVPTHAGSRWMVPIEYVPTAKINLTPEIPTGVALSHFQLQNLTLANYLLP
jgi:hypothetical protein